jgi:hypothetical protein
VQTEETMHMEEVQEPRGQQPVVLTRKERNHVAGLAAMHMGWAGEAISPTLKQLTPHEERENAQRIAVLFNLREDLGWEGKVKRGGHRRWPLSLTPPATMRGLLRGWGRATREQLVYIELGLAEAIAAKDARREAEQREEVEKATRSLRRTSVLLARLEHQEVEGRDDEPERPMLTVADVRAARARINATYDVGEVIDDPDAANRIDAQGDAERMALYERVIGACAGGNVEDAEQAMRLAIGWESV